MPLTMVAPGVEAVVSGYNLKDSTKKFLEGLGIVPGTIISVISEMGGNLIVCVKGSRIAINKGIAQQLMVDDIKCCTRGRHRRRHGGGGNCVCQKL